MLEEWAKEEDSRRSHNEDGSLGEDGCILSPMLIAES
jgi:hypothetical protein